MTREEAVKMLGRLLLYCDSFECPHHDCDKCVEAINMAEDALEQEPKRGKWLDYLEEGLKWECSECGSKFTTPWHYCPNCGARMESDE